MENLKEAVGNWAQNAKQNAGLVVGMGVLTAIGGLLAITAPFATGMGVAFVVGIAMATAGVARCIAAFSAGSFGQGALAFVGGMFAFVAGGLLASRPGFGLATLTLMLGAYLLVDGISSAILAFHVRPTEGWGWMLFSAVMGVLLGVLLLRDWPLAGNWAVGTMVGINLVVAGASLISIGSAARKVTSRLAEAV
jgi:uncharacterized membrane protein HdeD (DUF308 family)